MELGLKGRTAIVCASSKGLGLACALELAREGAQVVINGRSAGSLEQAAAQILADCGAKVIPVVSDISQPEGRAALLAAAPEPDILVNNAGGPPVGDFRDWSREDWIRAIDTNMLAAIELIRATIDPMIRRKFGRIINITSGVVKAPVSYLGLSNGARSGLTGFVGGLAREVSQHNVTINNLLPGSFATDRLLESAASLATSEGRTSEELCDLWQQAEASRRFGRPEEFGAACAFFCSARAGYLTGQNILLDGGTYPGTF